MPPRDKLRYLKRYFLPLILYPAFLLVPEMLVKTVLLGLLSLVSCGWYAILRVKLYSAMLGLSGTSMAVNNLAGLAWSLMPLGLGWVAQRYNLGLTMWLLLLGPVVLGAGLLKRGKQST